MDNSFIQAKQEALSNGKEPFDFEKFATLYLHDTGDCKQLTQRESEAVKKEYERKYYVRHPEIKTVSDFADYLNSIENSQLVFTAG